jgi:predicted ATPase/class 3 adenylate cyclase/DNA-binding CsgD family transcriptional regulator
MRELPGGTVTLLFTDIEGSTRLQQQVGERYAEVVATWRQLLRAIFHGFHGHEVDTQGDAFFVAFARATDAVLAAVEMQHALATHTLPGGVSVRVRIGLHTGQPRLSAEGYVGLDVPHAERIMSAGHGGQVLLSASTQELVKHDLPDGVSLLDLGEYRLKDLQHPSHLFQVVMPGLPADFPPLKTLDSHPNNLPTQPTTLIGREQEVAAVAHLLRREELRLVTLTGPGGIGKTRLALQVAAEVGDRFADGVYFVNLAPVSDPAFVVPTIAQVLAVKEIAGQSLLEQLQSYLGEKRFLLLLDNFEQVVGAAVQVAGLLAACPKLKVVVTSRMPLHVQAEQEFAAPPLAVPNPKHVPDLGALSQYEAVALFIARTQAVKPDFQVTSENAPAVAEICVRLDGLPLALELAAARIKLFSPQALLARLGQRLVLLTTGARDAPARQQTLRNTIAWSYDLLTAAEQRLFRRLSLFAGGCTLEEFESVCTTLDAQAGHLLDGVASLLDKSLLQQSEQEEGESQISMLETIREFGLEALRESAEAEACHRAYAQYYLALAEETEPHLKGAQQVQWWKRLEREQENLRAALSWLIEQEEGELALRLTASLWWFWNIRGYWSEGERWQEAVLRLPQVQERTARRAKVLLGAGVLASQQGHPAARSLLEESVAIFRELADKRGLVEALVRLSRSMYHQSDEHLAGRRLGEESVALAREVGDPWLLANALRNLGIYMSFRDDLKRGRLLLEESVTLFRALHDQQGLSDTLIELVGAMVIAGQATQAAALAEESLALTRALGNRPDLTRALYWVAQIQLFQGETERAVALLEENLALAREQGDKRRIGIAQSTLGGLALYRGDLVAAETCAQESLALSRELRYKTLTAMALSLLGEVKRRQGDLAQARALCTEGLSLAVEAASRNDLGWNLIGLARVAADEGQSEQAARLFGAAEPCLLHNDMDPLERADYERAVAEVRARLGEEAFAAAWAKGRSMTPEQALAAHEQGTIPVPVSEGLVSSSLTAVPARSLAGLSSREVEVLRLVAQGMTNEQVAEQLVMSPHTVKSHLTTIYGKIGVTSRRAATRYAIEHHFI